MKELFDSHTSSHISAAIMDTLRRFQIDINQLLSYTIDNAQNMLKAGEMLQEFQSAKRVVELIESERAQYISSNIENNENSASDSETIESDFEDHHEIESLEQDDAQEENNLKKVLEGVKNISSTVTVQRCSCHLINLTVQDALSSLDNDAKNAILEARKVVKNLRNITFSVRAKSMKIKLPPLDVPTRWNSLYLMLSSLEKIREQLNALTECYSGRERELISISESTWHFIEQFNRLFILPYELTLKLQREDISFSKLQYHFLLTT